MVDTAALGAVVARHVGSSPTWGTKTIKMKRLLLILPLLFFSLFTVKSQNFGQVNENSILKIEYFKFENNNHYFKVINKLNCEIQIQLNKPTNQFSDHALVANSYMMVEIHGSATIMTNIKARRTFGAVCVSSPDNGWVEMSSPIVLPVTFQNKFGYCLNPDNSIDFTFGVEQTSDIKIYNIKYSSDGRTFKTIQTVQPNKLLGPQIYKVKLK